MIWSHTLSLSLSRYPSSLFLYVLGALSVAGMAYYSFGSYFAPATKKVQKKQFLKLKTKIIH